VSKLLPEADARSELQGLKLSKDRSSSVKIGIMEVTIGQHQLATWLSAIYVAKFKGKKTVFELVYFTWIMVQEKKRS
jgi:hypothetical protein